MRLSFGGMERLKARARENLANGNERIRRWWCDKYKRPPNHPLFLERSYAEWSIEMIEDLLERQAEIIQQMRDGVIKTRIGDEMLARISDALGEEAISEDPLFDQWERDIAAGKEPDLEAM